MDGEDNKPVVTDAPAAVVDGGGASPVDAGAGGVKPDAGAAAAAGSDKGTAEDAKADQPKKDDLAPAEPDEPVVRQRKTNKDYIIERKEAKIKKLAEAKATGVQNDGGEIADDDESDADAIVEERISRALDQRLAPLLERQQEEEDSREVEAVMKDFPELVDLTPKLKEWMKHPSRSNIPARSILYEIAGPRLMKIGAERERKAAESAKQTQTGGGTQRTDGGDKKPQDMTDAEFAVYAEGIKNGR